MDERSEGMAARDPRGADRAPHGDAAEDEAAMGRGDRAAARGARPRERARTIGIYWPFKAEFDPRPLATRLLGEGFRIALPVVIEKKRPMIFRLWTPETPMTSGIWDIPVPADSETVVPELLMAPVVGFDAARYRLGYGGGYFDRTLGSLSPRPIAIGVGFELGRLETIFPQPFDVPMNHIVTEAGAA